MKRAVFAVALVATVKCRRTRAKDASAALLSSEGVRG